VAEGGGRGEVGFWEEGPVRGGRKKWGKGVRKVCAAGEEGLGGDRKEGGGFGETMVQDGIVKLERWMGELDGRGQRGKGNVRRSGVGGEGWVTLEGECGWGE